ncbi:MAG TPA: S-layer homology domain-containing protein, partial [Thermoanaerobaculia bacterium]|nr:S-layer homology domain-containing protein [Thermoanaerobaculia bacterium]
RLRTLKSLYDPTYIDESWIGTCCGPTAVQLLPRMKQWIADRYPGTKLSISEYNWGGDTGISSALAQAEALAIFGREGVDLATRWVAPDAGSRVEEAFRLYLDYDGQGGAVSGDSVTATSSNVDDVGAYAVAGAGTRLFFLLFNKATADRDAVVTLPSPLHWRARLWRFDGTDDLGSAGTASPSGGSLTLTLPTYSATLAVTLADFGDVPVSHPFYGDVMTVADDGVSAGCGDGNFCPATPVTRAQMAVFLLKASFGEGYAPPPATGTVFADVPASAFAAAWIEDLAARGITGGCGGGNFCPNASVTRAQMAVFLLKTLLGTSYTPPAATGVFGDVPPGSFAAAWIEDLYHRDITSGCQASPLLYCPAAANTRGQMAVFVSKTFTLP